MKFQNPSFIFFERTDKRTNAQTDKRTSRKQYAPHFFKVWGIFYSVGDSFASNTIPWIRQSPKSPTASSSAAAQNSRSVTTPLELPVSSTADRIPVSDKTSPPATRKMYPRAIVVDYFDKCVIRQKIAEDGFPTITAKRWPSVCEHVKRRLKFIVMAFDSIKYIIKRKYQKRERK